MNYFDHQADKAFKPGQRRVAYEVREEEITRSNIRELTVPMIAGHIRKALKERELALLFRMRGRK